MKTRVNFHQSWLLLTPVIIRSCYGCCFPNVNNLPRDCLLGYGVWCLRHHLEHHILGPMAELLRHLQILRKAQEVMIYPVVGKVKLVDETTCPTPKQSSKVFYAYTLWYHWTPRRPNETCILSGYTVPRNTLAIHRDPKLWDSPLEFQPERFLRDESNFQHSGINRTCVTYLLGWEEDMCRYFLWRYSFPQQSVQSNRKSRRNEDNPKGMRICRIQEIRR